MQFNNASYLFLFTVCELILGTVSSSLVILTYIAQPIKTIVCILREQGVVLPEIKKKIYYSVIGKLLCKIWISVIMKCSLILMTLLYKGNCLNLPAFKEHFPSLVGAVIGHEGNDFIKSFLGLHTLQNWGSKFFNFTSQVFPQRSY